MACPAPDPLVGTVVRLSNFLDCNAQLLGREGFLTLAGFSTSSGLINGVLTILIALIGYRLLMGHVVRLHDLTGWTIRIGAVIALLAGWPVFQTLFYDIAITAPQDMAQRLSASIDVPDDNLADRVQRAYDILRLGTAIDPSIPPAEGQVDQIGSSVFKFQPPMPKVATAFFLVTSGLAGAAKMAAAFLLAVAPFPFFSLLFAPTYGLFVGWIRALVTSIFAATATIFASSLHIFAVEAELARIQDSVGIVNAARLDAEAIIPTVLVFILLTVGLLFVAIRLSGAIAAAVLPKSARQSEVNVHEGSTERNSSQAVLPNGRAVEPHANERPYENERVVMISDALHDAMRRESGLAFPVGTGSLSAGGSEGQAMLASSPGGAERRDTGRRALGRRHRSAMRRDKLR